ncbi:hypothetical protein NMY22_g4322 [Coprinellus aureogranulatus]|nr:hypothetical protein NMY22_g4322 [Coprinellus aureogranulatus]
MLADSPRSKQLRVNATPVASGRERLPTCRWSGAPTTPATRFEEAPLSCLVSAETACRRVSRPRQNHHHLCICMHLSPSPRGGSPLSAAISSSLKVRISIRMLRFRFSLLAANLLYAHKMPGTEVEVVVPSVSQFSLETRSLLTTPCIPIPKGYEEKLLARRATLQTEILAIENRWNALLPVNRLPHEILSTIFEIVKALWEQGYFKRRLFWMRLSFVCRHWREIALETTSLWTNVDFANPAIGELMLSRSKKALLEVSFKTLPSPQSEVLLRKTLSQTQRLRSIDVLLRHESSSEVLWVAIGPAPYLQTLAARNCSATLAKLPGQFFEGKSSALKHLTLEGFDLVSSWENLPLSKSLRTLHLNGWRQSLRPSSQRFFEVMRPLLCLEELTLRHVLPLAEVRSPTTNEGDIPTFLNVASLTLSDLGNQIVHFLRHSHFPKCRHLSLSLKNTLNGQEAIRMGPIAQVLAHLEIFASGHTRSSEVQSGTKAYLRKIEIIDTVASAGTYTFTFQQEGTEEEDADVQVRVDIERSRVERSRFPPWEALLAEVYTRMDMSRLQSLVLAGCQEIPASDWKVAFAQLTGLTTIRFASTPFLQFLEVMKQDPSLPKRYSKTSYCDTFSSPTYFPALINIKFVVVNFQKQLISQLAQCLKKRPASWPSIKLHVQHSRSFTSQHAEILEKAAPGVQLSWDARLHHRPRSRVTGMVELVPGPWAHPRN